jgi:hypothetical protein
MSSEKKHHHKSKHHHHHKKNKHCKDETIEIIVKCGDCEKDCKCHDHPIDPKINKFLNLQPSSTVTPIIENQEPPTSLIDAFQVESGALQGFNNTLGQFTAQEDGEYSFNFNVVWRTVDNTFPPIPLPFLGSFVGNRFIRLYYKNSDPHAPFLPVHIYGNGSYFGPLPFPSPPAPTIPNPRDVGGFNSTYGGNYYAYTSTSATIHLKKGDAILLEVYADFKIYDSDNNLVTDTSNYILVIDPYLTIVQL